MKRKKKLVITLNAALAPILAVITNLISSSFPSVPGPILWSGAGGIVLIAIIISVLVALLEDDKNEVQAGSPVSQLAQKPIQRAAKVQKTSSAFVSGKHSALGTVQINPTSRQLSIDNPMLICMAIDVSYSMKSPIFDQTKGTIQRWASVTNAIEQFAHLGVALFKDPATQRVLPLYHLMAYGFGFTDKLYGLGINKNKKGEVRDLLNHPSLPSLPSASEISEYWGEYKDNLLDFSKYTMDLFGTSPMRQCLIAIRDRIKEEQSKINFATPILLLIISDGLPDDGDPLPIVKELQQMNVLTLCCYLADQDVLASQILYDAEDDNWSEGAKKLFNCASPLLKDNNVTVAIFDALDKAGWQPHEGVRLFAQVNQTDGLNTFLEVMFRGSLAERGGADK